MPKRPASKSKHKIVQIWKLYKISGENVSRSAPTCPKCRSFMARHKKPERLVCGKCGYVETKRAA